MIVQSFQETTQTRPAGAATTQGNGPFHASPADKRVKDLKPTVAVDSYGSAMH